MPLCELRYFSPALVKQTSATIILPEPTSPKPWSTLYLLHGLSDDHTIWSRRTSVERYVEGLPLAVVMPDGGRSFYCDAVEGYAYGTAIGRELPALIEATFPVRREREGRMIAGLSMGGYGAFRLALERPDGFCGAVSHSGALAFGSRALDLSDPFGREFVRVLGPDPAFGPNDLFSAVRKLKERGAEMPSLAFDCGTEDFLLDANRAFREHLQELGVPHTYTEFPGGHEWSYWDTHIQETIAFACRQMGLQRAGSV